MKAVKKNIIRYANCWEDADLLLSSLSIQRGDKVLSVGSGGDNSFALLSNAPSLVVAIDINPIQLHVIELKKAAIKTLNYTTFLEFLGFRESKRRKEIYSQLVHVLPNKTKDFWDRSFKQIEKGVIYSGKFEKYFRFFARFIVPLIHSKKTIDRLFKKKSAQEQRIFYNEVWENKRWKWLFKIFFSRFIMGKFGRDPSFFNEVKIPVAEYIFDKSKNHLSSTEAQSNYFLYFILTGHFGENLPYYAREENFESIKRNIDSLKTELNTVENVDIVTTGYNKFNLSNIFEYLNMDEFKAIAEKLTANSDSQSRFAYWNLMVNRDMTEISGKVEKISSDNFKDKGFFYKSFHSNLVQ